VAVQAVVGFQPGFGDAEPPDRVFGLESERRHGDVDLAAKAHGQAHTEWLVTLDGCVQPRQRILRLAKSERVGGAREPTQMLVDPEKAFLRLPAHGFDQREIH